MIVGVLLVIGAAFLTKVMWPVLLDPTPRPGSPGERPRTVSKDFMEGRSDRDPDAIRSKMRWPVLLVPGVWCAVLTPWPRTIDHLMRGEWNVLTSGPSSQWAEMVAGFLSAGVVLCVVLGFTINYWNRPKFLVHPYFRDDPGLFAARRLRAQGVDVDALYEGSAERWRERRRRRGGV